MKIAIDTYGCDHGKSGLGSYLINFISNIPADCEHEIELFGSEIDRYTYQSEKDLTFNAVLPFDNDKLVERWHLRKINKFLKKNNYDLVIYPAVSKVLPLQFKTKGIAVVNSVMTAAMANFDHKKRHQIKKGLHRVNLIIAASEFIKKDLLKLGLDASKIIVIHNGIDHKRFYPSEDPFSDIVEINPFSIKKPYFLYCSRLSDEDKKHEQLIKAFNIFKEKTGLPHRLVLSGTEGDYSEKIHRVAFNSQYGSDILLTGFFPYDSLPKLYSGAAACVFPATQEGVGLPILEAMASGIPVICSNSGVLPEIGGNVPIYFDSNDVYDIAYSMQKVVNEAELSSKMVTKGLEWASNFNWSDTVNKTLEAAAKL
ncbi:MAG: glycosyltransferase family 4 protein [Treponema sp.]|nr:glycosyltransferase family 4 protein [Treponema sp.]